MPARRSPFESMQASRRSTPTFWSNPHIHFYRIIAGEVSLDGAATGTWLYLENLLERYYERSRYRR